MLIRVAGAAGPQHQCFPISPHPPTATTTRSPYALPSASDLGSRPEPVGIRARLLIPGRGEPIHDAVVVITGDTIAWVGPQSGLPSEYDHVRFAVEVPVLLPGLWDCHVHYGGLTVAAAQAGSAGGLLPTAAPWAGAVTAVDFRRTLAAGFTSVRELAGTAGYLVPAIREGSIPGPNVYSSICALSPTGGHGDAHDMPLAAIEGASRACGHGVAICDGVDECVKMVRKMVRQGAKVIKVCATGGVLSINDDPRDREFNDEELSAMVKEASLSGLAVAAHCHGKEGIMAALRAGVTTIEHGMSGRKYIPTGPPEPR